MNRIGQALIVFLIFIAFNANSEDGYKNFIPILDQAKMKLEKPLNMKETPVIKNDELYYQYAVKDSIMGFEIRYLVYPLQELVNKYNSPHPDTGMTHLDPNMIHTNLLVMYSLKIQGKEMAVDAFPEIKEINHATADLEFNADWAAQVNITPCDEFAQKYKYATILELHKDNIADAFVIFLYNDKDKYDDMMKPVFHTLRFIK